MKLRVTFLCLVVCSLLTAHPPVDVVYTWVDGSDPAWQKSKQEELTRIHPSATKDATSIRRFRSRDELRYSLRSIHRFAPWINHIYIVTCGHRPKWLRPHPKITVISHAEIFSDSSHLPTFNSMAIESHLHHIPGLQEHYIYFNDDVFLGKAASYTTFFTKKGKSRFVFSRKKLPKDPPQPGDSGYISAQKNTANFLNTLYGHKKRRAFSHTPFAFTKSAVTMIEKKCAHIFSLVSSHKFRSLHDYTITNGLIPQIALAEGLAKKSNATKKVIFYGNDEKHNKRLLDFVNKNHPCFFCIEDSVDQETDGSKLLLQEFFHNYFPEAAPWENPDIQ